MCAPLLGEQLDSCEFSVTMRVKRSISFSSNRAFDPFEEIFARVEVILS
jgi:hypothetical protein